MFLSLLKKNKVIDIFMDINFSTKDKFLEDIMRPDYQSFLNDKIK